MDYLFNIIGLAGVALIVVAYFLIQTNKLPVTGFLYSFLNMAGALLIMVSFIVAWNFAAFVVEFFWLIISIYGLIKYFLHKRQHA